MTGYQVCVLYKALKLHFSSDYDFIKYKGKVKYSVMQYQNNKHKYVYEKLSRKYSDTDIKKFFIANLLQNERIWIHELLAQEAHDNFVQFNKKHQSLSYVFENDLLNIFSVENHQEIFKCDKGDFPLLLTKVLRGEVCMETLIIMDRFMEFVPRWESRICDTYIWPSVKTKLLKYKPFLTYDTVKFKQTLVDCIKENCIVSQ